MIVVSGLVVDLRQKDVYTVAVRDEFLFLCYIGGARSLANRDCLPTCLPFATVVFSRHYAQYATAYVFSDNPSVNPL